MIILAFIVIALVAGFIANWLVGRKYTYETWELFVAGIIGSFVGGLIFNLIAGNGSISASRAHRLNDRRHRGPGHLRSGSHAVAQAQRTRSSTDRPHDQALAHEWDQIRGRLQPEGWQPTIIRRLLLRRPRGPDPAQVQARHARRCAH